MASIATAWPILPGKLETWRRFYAEMQGARRAAYDASSRRLGTKACRMYYQQTAEADLALVYLEAVDIGQLFQGMATSQDPYDVWFRAQVLDIHGWDVTQPLPGPLPELVFEWQAHSNAAPSPQGIILHEAVTLVNRLNDACNTEDIEGALALFTPDAVVQTLPPPPSGQAVWSGTEQVRAFLQWQVDEHFHVTSHNVQVSGTTMTWNSTAAMESFGQLGLPTVEVLVEAVVRDGKFSSFTGTLSPDTQRKIQAAMQQGSAAPV